MTKRQFENIREGDTVFAHFGSHYRTCKVVKKCRAHLHVEGDSARGGKLFRIAAFRSVDVVSGDWYDMKRESAGG